MEPQKKRPGEFEVIGRYFAPLAEAYPGALNLTDDAALVRHAEGRELAVTTDALVAGVHFLPDDPPADIAAKALRVNLSDLASMGAEPLAYTPGPGPDFRHRRGLVGCLFRVAWRRSA